MVLEASEDISSVLRPSSNHPRSTSNPPWVEFPHTLVAEMIDCLSLAKQHSMKWRSA